MNVTESTRELGGGPCHAMAAAATVLQGGMHGVMEQSLSQPSVAVGAIVALRLFDVAYAIDLARAEALLAQQARASRRIRLSTTPPKAMAFGVPPLALELNPIALRLEEDQEVS